MARFQKLLPIFVKNDLFTNGRQLTKLLWIICEGLGVTDFPIGHAPQLDAHMNWVADVLVPVLGGLEDYCILEKLSMWHDSHWWTSVQ